MWGAAVKVDQVHGKSSIERTEGTVTDLIALDGFGKTIGETLLLQCMISVKVIVIPPWWT